MELPTLEQDLADIRASAAQRKAEAAIPQVNFQGGTGGPSPVSAVEGALGEFAESPIGKAAQGLQSAVEGTTRWVKNLPKNLSLGALDAAKNTIDTSFDLSALTTLPVTNAATDAAYDNAQTALFGTFNQWRASLRDEDSMSDSLTQGIAQFMLPFTAWAKGVGVSSKIGLGANFLRGLVAEGMTSATAFSPQDGRVADLVDLGRHSEGRFGDVLRQISPDGSVVNAYINWMAERDENGPMAERFKNAVDGLVPSVAVAGVLKAAGVTFRAARNVPAALRENSVSPGSRRSQEGKIVFHGTPHEVDKFDLNKIGTGEGQQAHGYGLYFAESKDVANTYRGSGDIVHRLASASMYKHNNDWQKAVADLRSRGDNRSAAAANALEKGKGKLTGGNLYHVDIPDEAIARMLDADRPLADQPEVLRKLAAAGYQPKSATETGGEFVRRYGREGFDAILADDLAKAGIPGIRFLDGRSRTTGSDGTRNIVLFDDKLAKIVNKE